MLKHITLICEVRRKGCTRGPCHGLCDGDGSREKWLLGANVVLRDSRLCTWHTTDDER